DRGRRQVDAGLGGDVGLELHDGGGREAGPHAVEDVLDGAGPAGRDRADLDGGGGARGADRGGHLGVAAGGDGAVSDVLELVGDPHAAGGGGVPAPLVGGAHGAVAEGGIGGTGRRGGRRRGVGCAPRGDGGVARVGGHNRERRPLGRSGAPGDECRGSGTAGRGPGCARRG